MIAMQLSGKMWLLVAKNETWGVFHIEKELYAAAEHLRDNTNDRYLALRAALEEIGKLFDA